MDDNRFDEMIRQVPDRIDTKRIWRVRRSILIALPPYKPAWLRIFQPQAALIAATALFGLLLGISVPTILPYAGATADIVSPADPVGGFG